MAEDVYKLMIKIGIVGDIGCGKSFVSKQFGYPVFNADKEVLKIYKKNKTCYIKLKKLFPKNIKSFPVKKNHLFKVVLQKSTNLKKIEKIIHPLVQKKMKKFISKHKKRKILIFDIPLLLENKKYKNEFLVVYIEANRKEIEKELKKRKNYNPLIIKRLKKAQLPLEIKKKKSDFVLKNNFKSSYIKSKVKTLIKKILKNE